MELIIHYCKGHIRDVFMSALRMKLLFFLWLKMFKDKGGLIGTVPVLLNQWCCKHL